ncbi:hypothetical protein [Bradyrhizobium canariense]|uniref:hypothetical protein n=1 Tax=Bradyrhizobium canariense TaxID=255045 RepID=UPI000A1906E2|nr:hypothetical protein [Bradyrhizobium canariense]OSI32788.1 hypothetical protein BST65_03775 [Bradyrhizobium canariense]OSI36868.1 hypothetical protein BST66_05370 [Bradyrhizobium canariense]OSI49985.1 hypothetical protein BSZ20_06365 [Bradyrhizobium canariense]OSI55589.1 hypothetical protein BST67_04970 [Bradyrhizobium canariense]
MSEVRSGDVQALSRVLAEFSLGQVSAKAIDATAASGEVILRFDNVIPRALFDKKGRERYPSCGELVAELEGHALWRLGSSDVVIGLSAIVGQALQTVQSARFEAGCRSGPTLIRLEHPSFMMRRPVHERTDYIRRLRECFRSAVDAAITPRAAALAGA